jgi:hypothetical protein
LRSKTRVEVLDSVGKEKKQTLIHRDHMLILNNHPSCRHFHQLLKLIVGCFRVSWRTQIRI